MEGHEVKAIRAALGITQAELARRLTALDNKKVSRRTVESWEWDLRSPGEENERKLNELKAKQPR